ncbi:PREDICTED: uncharacterized protein LOC107337236 [Acropora digitifera]|uniref:uncharacterized protein LOC107337236 n=1 Tax=Acropora digitifera TaxID=70779 RepID=UPI00077A370F|nr:PREDICTED: uncharacterized protein LOC107337236 [Acropora digitifera]
MHPVFHLITLCYIRSAVVLLGLPAYSFSLFAILTLLAITTSNSILAIDAGYMHYHLWSETRQTGYLVGVTVRLESALSALDLVKKMERVKERRSSNHATKDHPEEITKNLHGNLPPHKN